METFFVAVLLAAGVALAVGSRRYNKWAATARASGRTAWWTRSVGSEVDSQLSRGTVWRNRIVAAVGLAAVVLSFVASGTASWVFSGVAALAWVAIYTSRFRA
jgi:hypothetical protein